MIPLSHWSFSEMQAAFGWSLEEYVLCGGYPGAAPLIGEPERWARYVADSLIETSISRDVLLLTRVDKPALLRRLFELACRYSGQVLSYTKMLGQLQDAGNTTTLAHYLELLAAELAGPAFEPNGGLHQMSTVLGRHQHTTGIIRNYVQRIRNHPAPAAERVRVAFIAPSTVAFGMIRMFEVLASFDVPRDRAVFQTMDEALAWLRTAPEQA